MNLQIDEWEMKEKLEQLVCDRHQAQMEYVLVNENLIGKYKLQCRICFEENLQPCFTYTIKKAIIKIQNYKNEEHGEYQRILEENLKTLNDYIEDIAQFKIEVLQLIDGLQAALNNYNQDLQKKLNAPKRFSFLEELFLIDQYPQLKRIREDAFEQIQNLRYSYSEKVVKNIYNLQYLISQNYQLKKILSTFDNQPDIHQSPKKVTNLKKIEYRQGAIPEIIFKGDNSEIIDIYKPKFQQKEKIICSKLKHIQPNFGQCRAISFNYDDSILATACNSEISLLKIQDGIIINLIDTLRDHSQEIETIIFSKKKNWLFSAGKDRSIILWKQIKLPFNFNFNKTQQQFNAHQDSILQILLNQTETQLISCCSDGSISIWNVNYQRNSIQFEYSLQIHKSPVISISLNLDNNLMVSSGLDKQIIVWYLNKNKQWKFKQKLESSANDFGSRISFLSNDTIIWQQFRLGVIHIFKEENGIFIEQPDQRLKLFEKDEKDGDYSFPSIFNYEKQLLIQKHHKRIYFFTVNYQNILILEQEYIQLDDEQSCGNLSNNGQYLAIWSKETLRIYEILECE